MPGSGLRAGGSWQSQRYEAGPAAGICRETTLQRTAYAPWHRRMVTAEGLAAATGHDHEYRQRSRRLTEDGSERAGSGGRGRIRRPACRAPDSQGRSRGGRPGGTGAGRRPGLVQALVPGRSAHCGRTGRRVGAGRLRPDARGSRRVRPESRGHDHVLLPPGAAWRRTDHARRHGLVCQGPRARGGHGRAGHITGGDSCRMAGLRPLRWPPSSRAPSSQTACPPDRLPPPAVADLTAGFGPRPCWRVAGGNGLLAQRLAGGSANESGCAVRSGLSSMIGTESGCSPATPRWPAMPSSSPCRCPCCKPCRSRLRCRAATVGLAPRRAGA